MEQPYYRLRQLIKNKYGEEKFSLGCELTARWLRINARAQHQTNDIRNYCNIHSEYLHEWSPQEAKALCQLFGLKRNEELYTYPEQTPEHLKT